MSGSNALVQARAFGDCCELSGLILTKLDGTGKGGVAAAICEQCGTPVRYVGLGEQPADLEPFDPALFAEAQERNEIRDVDPAQLAGYFLSLMDGISYSSTSGFVDTAMDVLVRDAIDVLLNGLWEQEAET